MLLSMSFRDGSGHVYPREIPMSSAPVRVRHMNPAHMSVPAYSVVFDPHSDRGRPSSLRMNPTHDNVLYHA